MSILADVLQRAYDARAQGEVLERLGLPPAEWRALLAELRACERHTRGQAQEEKDLGIPPPWERPDPDEVTLWSQYGPVTVYESGPMVLSHPSYSGTITGVDP